jgi:hypothetical protein
VDSDCFEMGSWYKETLEGIRAYNFNILKEGAMDFIQ